MDTLLCFVYGCFHDTMNGRVEYLQRQPQVRTMKAKIFTIWSFPEKVSDLDYLENIHFGSKIFKFLYGI